MATAADTATASAVRISIVGAHMLSSRSLLNLRSFVPKQYRPLPSFSKRDIQIYTSLYRTPDVITKEEAIDAREGEIEAVSDPLGARSEALIGEGNRTFTMRDLLNELKGDGNGSRSVEFEGNKNVDSPSFSCSSTFYFVLIYEFARLCI